MTIDPKDVSRKIYEDAWNAGKLDALDELLAPDHVNVDPNLPGGEARGRAGYKQVVQMYRAAFSNLRFTLEDNVAASDWVTTRWTARGTHDGALGPIPPTGRDAVVTGLSTTHVKAGQAVVTYAQWDATGLMRQLGLVPPPPAGALALMSRWWERFEAGDLAGALELSHDDIDFRLPGAELRGKAGARATLQVWVDGFSGFRHEVLHAVELGDTIAVELAVSAVHTGDFVTPMGTMAATGKTILLRSCDVVRVRDGKIASWHAYFDPTTLAAQLGIAPPG